MVIELLRAVQCSAVTGVKRVSRQDGDVVPGCQGIFGPGDRSPKSGPTSSQGGAPCRTTESSRKTTMWE